MGCQSSSEKYKEKLFQLSKFPKHQTQFIIDQILKLTEFTEKEIFFLMKHFYSLEPNEEGLISNSQLLEFPQFKYSPFKKNLIRVFKLDTTLDMDVQPYLKEDKEDFIEFNTDKKSTNKLIDSVNVNDVQNEQKSVSSKNHDVIIMDFGNQGVLDNENENKKNYKSLNKNNFISSIDNQNKRSFYANLPEPVNIKYITFQKFCEIMNVFYFNGDVELKMRCNFLHIIY
jgi:hypothetical protein